MGIPLFYGEWISKVPYPDVNIRITNNDIIEGISIDMNGLLHSVAQVTITIKEPEVALLKIAPEKGGVRVNEIY